MTTVGGIVPDKARWRALVARSNGPAALRLAVHGGLIAALGGLIGARIPLWPLLLLPQGLLLIFLFAPLHEAVHRTAFRTRWCNDLLALVCGWLLVLPPTWFRHFHLSHHRFTNDPARDPELAANKPECRRDYIIHMSGLPTWWAQMRGLLANALGRNRDRFIPRKAHRRVTVEAAWFLAGYAIAYQTAGEQLLWLWAVPVLIGQPFLRAFLLAEHRGCAEVPDMLANSRTTLTAPALRLLSWNMSYHAEHHAQPAVPFHRLSDLHAFARPHLQVLQHGYLDLHKKFLANLS